MAYRKRLARALRRNATDAENALWKHLRACRMVGVKFRRQHPMGPYVVDFACVERRIIIEVDGGQHGDQREDDAKRSEYLAKRGYTVLRFWNNQVLTEGDRVVEVIWRALKSGGDVSDPTSP